MSESDGTMKAELQFDPAGRLTAVYLHARNEGEQRDLERALSRLIRPQHEGRCRALLRRIK